MITQFEQEFYNKNISHQDQSKGDPSDTPQNRIKFWLNIIINDEGSIPDNFYDYGYNDEGPDHSVRGSEIFPEIGELKNYWIYSEVNDSEKHQNIYKRNLFQTT